MRFTKREIMSLSLILASQSPRRKELLKQVGYQFTCKPANINECIRENEQANDYVKRLAIEKADTIYQSLTVTEKPRTLVLGSDTSVVYNNIILGKPQNITECISQLSMLSGQTHQVLTAIAVVGKSGVSAEVVTTNVSFKLLTEDEIMSYWETGEPKDKAGSYGIQGIAGQFVSSISGSYSAVVGLPLFETTQLLSTFELYTPLQSSLN